MATASTYQSCAIALRYFYAHDCGRRGGHQAPLSLASASFANTWRGLSAWPHSVLAEIKTPSSAAVWASRRGHLLISVDSSAHGPLSLASTSNGASAASSIRRSMSSLSL